MKAELVNKNLALEKAEKLKEIAFGIAKANNTLPGYCSAPECVEYMDLLAATQLKEGENLIFINGEAAKQITAFELEGGNAICKIGVENAVEVNVSNNEMQIVFTDGVVEYYSFLENLGCWKFEKNNINNIKLPTRSIN